MYSRLNELLLSTNAVLLSSPHNLRYFSGFKGGEGAVLVFLDKRFLFTDSRYTEAAAVEAPDFTVIETNDYLGEACESLLREGAKTVMVEDAQMSVRNFYRITEMLGKTEIILGSAEIESLRMVKTDGELQKMQIAEEIAVKAFRHILGVIREGVCERDIALEMEYFMRKEGAEGVSFDTIAVSGKKSSLPHGRPDNKRVAYGDFLTMDFGCIYEGYCSDMTRTIVIGRASDEQKKIYETVRLAQRTGLEAIREGRTGKECDRAARLIIEEEGYGKYFGHSLGHGVGLLIHELPNLSPRCDIILKENMVVTCEPGIYIPDFGGVRIEDMVCVKKDGVVNLTAEPHKLIEL